MSGLDKSMIKEYYTLAKPGIIFGNIITATGGFALASQGHVNYLLLLTTVLGLSFVVGCACVFNNYIDREIDQKMARTKNRPLAKGVISVPRALVFGVLLGISGILILLQYANILTAITAATGFCVYVFLYSFLKYRSEYGTLVGSIAGAIPPVVGYVAVTNRLDMGAFILFVIVALWQMPHFFAIAMFRVNDYLAAAIPVLPIKRGMLTTKKHMLFYVIAFTVATLMLTVLGYTGYSCLIIAVLLGATWLFLCFKGFKTKNDMLWARHMFRFSLVVIMLLCIVISVDSR